MSMGGPRIGLCTCSQLVALIHELPTEFCEGIHAIG
jgi:hypothetical protein